MCYTIGPCWLSVLYIIVCILWSQIPNLCLPWIHLILWCCPQHCWWIFGYNRVQTQMYWWLRWQRIWLQCRRPRFDPWIGKIPWRMEWLPTPVFLPGEFHEQRSLTGYSPWGYKEWDTTDQLSVSLFSAGNIVATENTLNPAIWAYVALKVSDKGLDI